MASIKGINLTESLERALAGDAAEGEVEVDIPMEDDDTPVVLDSDPVDQPVVDADTDDLSLASITLVDGTEDPSSAPSVQGATFEVPNVGEVSADELVKGYMRQADYTQKTQELAALRKDLDSDEAKNVRELYKMLAEDPVGTVHRLAGEVGLITTDLPPTNKLPSAVSEDKVQEMVEARLRQALESTPEIQSLRQQAQAKQIESEFERIQSTYNHKFTPEEVISVINNAAQTGTNIELTFLRMREKYNQMKVEKERVKAVSTKTTHTQLPRSDVTKVRPKTISEAFERAKASLAE
jgi:hypothetical protein